MYDLLGFCLALAALLTINALSTLATALLWRGVGRFTQSWTAALRAKFLFALRILPSACALLCVAALLIPAYIAYEPLHTNEVVSAKLAALALLSFAGLSLALWRGLAAWSVTSKLIRDWLRHAEPVRIEGVEIPAYKIEHAFPVIAIVGVLRPKLFIAKTVCDLLTEEELSAAVAHEAGHLAARDNLKRWLLRACSDVLTIVPCGRALDRAWSESAEAAADERAARTGAHGALNLASALVKIARMAPTGTSPAMPAGAFLIGRDACGVVWRVRRLTQLASMSHNADSPASRAINFAVWSALTISLTALILIATNSNALATLHTFIEQIVSALK